MDIGIIGGGFYGCYLAQWLSEKKHNITIYEKNKNLLKEAISNNQHRLHLGFHYPRCDFTINQSKDTHNKFIEEFSDCVYEINNNLYAVHDDSMVDFETYKNKMDEHNLKYEILSKKQYNHLFKNPNKIQGVLRTGEKKINLSILKDLLIKRISQQNSIKVLFDSNIEKKHSIETKHDFVLNCTYTNPGLFLDKEEIRVKNELCFMPLLEIEEDYDGTSITVMDGNFCSFYQADIENTFTLSSVLYTPYFKSFDSESLYDIQRSLTEDKIRIICENIIEESKKIINLPKYNVKDCYISQKCKILNDKNDFRGSYCIKKNNTITIMSGKISAVFSLIQEVENFINE